MGKQEASQSKSTDRNANGTMKSGEQIREEAIQRTKLISEPVVRELRELGFQVDSISNLNGRRLEYKRAIPTLLKWLPLITDSYVKELIVRALSVPWARPVAALPLIREFKRPREASDLDLKWAIGNALEVVADDSVFEELSELARNKQYGRDREMLVLALGKMRNPTAVDVLVELLDDVDVAGHAVMALRKLGIETTRPHLERFVNHPQAWVRNEAKKALEKLDKARAKN